MRNLIFSALRLGVLVLAVASVNAQTYTSGDWQYVIENEEVTITRHIGSGGGVPLGAVTFPSSLDGMAVKKIGNDTPVFYYEITNGNAISGYYDTTVTSVTIPSGITHIGGNSFAWLVNLASVTIPNSVTTIGAYAFNGCGLNSILIPEGVINIGSNVFDWSEKLVSISVAPANTNFASQDGVLYDKNIATLIRFPPAKGGAFAIPTSVTSIADYAFYYCANLTNVTLPSGLTSIGNYAFMDCQNLSSISIPSSTVNFGTALFNGCYELLYAFVPDGFKLTEMGDNVFSSGTTVITPSLVDALANNDAFVTAVANKIKATGGNYGIATQSGLSSAIEPLATKTELTSSLAQSRTDGINSVLSNPNLWTLYTTSQIQNMAVGDLVLTRQVSGGFVLNYDIEQSTDLQTWTTYQALSLPLTGLPTDKAFVRIKPKQ